MRLARRDKTSGFILAFVDTKALTKEQAETLSEELHELVAQGKSHDADDITGQGLEAQLQYLIAQHGEDALTDIVLDALDAVDNRHFWK